MWNLEGSYDQVGFGRFRLSFFGRLVDSGTLPTSFRRSATVSLHRSATKSVGAG